MVAKKKCVECGELYGVIGLDILEKCTGCLDKLEKKS